MSKKRIGSTMRSLFVELGEEEDLELLTRKKVLADDLAASMERKHISKEALATAMNTSRTVVYRLLDPKDTGVTLETLSKASRALGLELRISFGESKAVRRGSKNAKARSEEKAVTKAGRPHVRSREPLAAT